MAAKKRARELLNGNGAGPEEITLVSGVTITVLPFPVGLFEDLSAKSMAEYPDPPPPQKTIQALGGTEEVDDLTNPAYLAEVERVKNQRGALLTEAILDLCVQLDLTPWESTIRKLEKYSLPFSEDPDERRLEFLSRYALRGKADYEIVMVSAMAQMINDDAEVAQRLESFQLQMEGAAASNTQASGASKEE